MFHLYDLNVSKIFLNPLSWPHLPFYFIIKLRRHHNKADKIWIKNNSTFTYLVNSELHSAWEYMVYKSEVIDTLLIELSAGRISISLNSNSSNMPPPTRFAVGLNCRIKPCPSKAPVMFMGILPYHHCWPVETLLTKNYFSRSKTMTKNSKNRLTTHELNTNLKIPH